MYKKSHLAKSTKYVQVWKKVLRNALEKMRFRKRNIYKKYLQNIVHRLIPKQYFETWMDTTLSHPENSIKLRL